MLVVSLEEVIIGFGEAFPRVSTYLSDVDRLGRAERRGVFLVPIRLHLYSGATRHHFWQVRCDHVPDAINGQLAEWDEPAHLHSAVETPGPVPSPIIVILKRLVFDDLLRNHLADALEHIWLLTCLDETNQVALLVLLLVVWSCLLSKTTRYSGIHSLDDGVELLGGTLE